MCDLFQVLLTGIIVCSCVASRRSCIYIKEVTVASQEMMKEHVDQMLLEPADTDVTFLMVSDPFE
jgi:hypothetical protein